jgi:hypothetical protein
MWKMLYSRLFGLLSEPSQEVTNEQIQNAYGHFVEQVEAVSQSENNYAEIYRMLNNTRIELVFLQTLYRYGQGEKCPEIRLSS